LMIKTLSQNGLQMPRTFLAYQSLSTAWVIINRSATLVEVKLTIVQR